MIDDFPPRKMTDIERVRLTLSIHHSKQDFKLRWKNLSPSSREAIRQEWGHYMNNSYPFKKGSEDYLEFFDYFNY